MTKNNGVQFALLNEKENFYFVHFFPLARHVTA